MQYYRYCHYHHQDHYHRVYHTGRHNPHYHLFTVAFLLLSPLIIHINIRTTDTHHPCPPPHRYPSLSYPFPSAICVLQSNTCVRRIATVISAIPSNAVSKLNPKHSSSNILHRLL